MNKEDGSQNIVTLQPDNYHQITLEEFKDVRQSLHNLTEGNIDEIYCVMYLLSNK